MAKSTKKAPDFKGIAKTQVLQAVKEALENLGYTVIDGEDLDFATKTLVVRGLTEDGVDVAITVVAPKAGQKTYDYRIETAEESVE